MYRILFSLAALLIIALASCTVKVNNTELPVTVPAVYGNPIIVLNQ